MPFFVLYCRQNFIFHSAYLIISVTLSIWSRSFLRCCCVGCLSRRLTGLSNRWEWWIHLSHLCGFGRRFRHCLRIWFSGWACLTFRFRIWARFRLRACFRGGITCRLCASQFWWSTGLPLGLFLWVCWACRCAGECLGEPRLISLERPGLAEWDWNGFELAEVKYLVIIMETCAIEF